MKVTNISTGPRGLNTKAGVEWLDAGQSADVDMEKAEIESAKGTGWFDIAGSAIEGDEDEVKRLRKEAADLDVKVDQRWGAPRLREEIDKALAK